jgi:prepilin-type processing-associated H-X9-DG protein/prepilin-type N-terminal cleavage/methylation domain-containing protein
MIRPRAQDCGPARRPARDAGGFTLIELLAVIGIVAVLAALLVPAALHALEEGRRVQCLANVRQCAIAAYGYTLDHEGAYPVAYGTAFEGSRRTLYAWDFTTVHEAGRVSVVPGLLWADGTDMRIQQCPSFAGTANWMKDPYTGYNYNTSYVGRPPRPAVAGEIGTPDACALFGDGAWSGGANKFMRSPFPSPFDAGFAGRHAGTQGFRHRGRSNIAFCDGHAVSTRERHTHYAGPAGRIADGTGFLSADNSLYDLE